MNRRMEEWKSIDGNAERRIYEVSNYGRVRSITKHGIITYLKPGIVDGYECVRVYGKNQRIHRLVANAFIPNEEMLPVVNHKDFNRRNNYVENLEWCTSHYNSLYSSKNLRIPHKVKPPNTGEKYIHKYSKNGYRVYFRRVDGTFYDKSFRTLEQAIEARDKAVGSHYE